MESEKVKKLDKGEKIMKVGIITLYHQNYNYGGQLQAYALVEAINKLGHTAEQIRLVNPIKRVQGDGKREKKSVGDLLYKIEKRMVQQLFLESKFALRRKAFAAFADDVPHSQDVYTAETIKEANQVYDAFIAGSDQIWNPVFTERGRLRTNLLDFVGDDKIRISYAASIGGFEIEKKDESDFQELLPKLDGISVREKTAKECFSKLAPGREISVCVDPVLLLTVDDWLRMSVEPEIGDEYLFCYFLSDNLKMRKRAKETARKNNWRIVTVPHMMTNYKRSDRCFGDVESYGVDPRQFVGLIANASFVMTDSFHAAVFSSIFKKQFLVFRRGYDENGTSMDSRLLDFTSHVGLETRFVEAGNDVDKPVQEKVDYRIFDSVTARDRTEGLGYLIERLRNREHRYSKCKGE